MTDVTLSVTRHADRWAIKHNGGVLGFAHSEREATVIAHDLLEWTSAHGRQGFIEFEASMASSLILRPGQEATD